VLLIVLHFLKGAYEMIEVKEAVRIAFQYMKEIFFEEQLYDLTLEEIELAEPSDDEPYWLVTVGFTRVLPLGLYSEALIANALSGQAVVNSTEANTAGTTWDRAIAWKPKRGKKSAAVSVSK
jgi:hypothetical protein